MVTLPTKGDSMRTSDTPSIRSSRSRRKIIGSGAIRLDGIISDPQVIEALNSLSKDQGSRVAAIEYALLIAFYSTTQKEQP